MVQRLKYKNQTFNISTKKYKILKVISEWGRFFLVQHKTEDIFKKRLINLTTINFSKVSQNNVNKITKL